MNERPCTYPSTYILHRCAATNQKQNADTCTHIHTCTYTRTHAHTSIIAYVLSHTTPWCRFREWHEHGISIIIYDKPHPLYIAKYANVECYTHTHTHTHIVILVDINGNVSRVDRESADTCKTCLRKVTHTHTNMPRLISACTHTRTHTHSHTHACTHARTHTHTHSHAHRHACRRNWERVAHRQSD